jgi:hypothetical protein
MERGLTLLEKWYRRQCNGDWEHSWGVKIGTLDNPGWTMAIALNETNAEYRILERVRIDRAEEDWIQYWVEKKTFQARCGPLNLTETIKIFVDWFES